MFGAYRIGANTPTKFALPKAVRDSLEEAGSSCMSVYDLAADTPNVVNGTMKVANFVTGQENGNVLSYYKQGASIGGPWVAWPAFLKDEMLRVLGEATSAGKDIALAREKACSIPGGLDLSNRSDNPCGRLNTFIENTWSPFLFELNDFVNRHRGWTDRLTGDLYTEIQEYRKRIIGLRNMAISLGVSMSAPAPKLPPPPAIEQLGAFVRTILFVLVGGVIVYFLFNTIFPLFKGGATVSA